MTAVLKFSTLLITHFVMVFVVVHLRKVLYQGKGPKEILSHCTFMVLVAKIVT